MSQKKTDEWLEQVFASTTNAELSVSYDAWADDYEANLAGLGYMHPSVAAGFVARCLPDLDAPILDAGTGTGMVGQVLAILGYRALHGIDLSDGMLAKARARGVYQELRNRILGNPLDYADGTFALVVSTGVLTVGHAPPESLDELVRVTRHGGHLVFSVGTSALKEHGFAAKLSGLESQKLIRQLHVTEPYRPMPFSSTEGTLTAQMFVYERSVS